MFDYTVKIRDKEIKYRKWKVKDKNKFLDGSKNGNVEKVKQSLVTDCLENPNLPLSQEELKYILFQIRRISISNTVEYNLTCGLCKNDFEYTPDINDIQVASYKSYGMIKHKNIELVMGDIQNKEYYDKILYACENAEQEYLMDFLLHIHELNESDAFTLDTLIEFVNDLDVDVAEDLFNQWNLMRFTLNDTHDVTCPHCGAKETYKFDDLPKFFPDSWF